MNTYRYLVVFVYLMVFFQIQINQASCFSCKRKKKDQITFNNDADINHQPFTQDPMEVNQIQDPMEVNQTQDPIKVNQDNENESIINIVAKKEKINQVFDINETSSIMINQKNNINAKIQKRKKLKMHLYAMIFTYILYENSSDTETFMQIMILQNIPPFTVNFSQFTFPPEFRIQKNYDLTLIQYMLLLENMYEICPQIILPVSILKAFFQAPKTKIEKLNNIEYFIFQKATKNLCLDDTITAEKIYLDTPVKVVQHFPAGELATRYYWQKYFKFDSGSLCRIYPSKDFSKVTFPKVLIFTFNLKLPPLILNILDLKITLFGVFYPKVISDTTMFSLTFEVKVHGKTFEMEFFGIQNLPNSHSNIEIKLRNSSSFLYFNFPVYMSTETDLWEYKYDKCYSAYGNRIDREKIDLYSILVKFF